MSLSRGKGRTGSDGWMERKGRRGSGCSLPHTLFSLLSPTSSPTKTITQMAFAVASRAGVAPVVTGCVWDGGWLRGGARGGRAWERRREGERAKTLRLTLPLTRSYPLPLFPQPPRRPGQGPHGKYGFSDKLTTRLCGLSGRQVARPLHVRGREWCSDSPTRQRPAMEKKKKKNAGSAPTSGRNRLAGSPVERPVF